MLAAYYKTKKELKANVGKALHYGETGNVEPIPCENAATVRAPECAFGNVIGEAHTVKQDAGRQRDPYW